MSHYVPYWTGMFTRR